MKDKRVFAALIDGLIGVVAALAVSGAVIYAARLVLEAAG